jgi:hypothetical protein
MKLRVSRSLLSMDVSGQLHVPAVLFLVFVTLRNPRKIS